MGNRCFKDESIELGHDSMDIDTEMPAHPASGGKGRPMGIPSINSGNWSTLPALEHAIKQRSGAVPPKKPVAITTPEEYQKARRDVTRMEQALAFDFVCFTNAGEKEREANAILQLLRQRDKDLFEKASPWNGYQNQSHKRHPSDHHLTNLDLVEKTQIFRVARRMPKGAHLHIHFNSCLEASFLLGLAKDQEKMDIGSNRPLVSTDDLYECEIQFTIRGELGGRAGVPPETPLKRAPTRKVIGNPPKPPVLVNLFDKEKFDQSEEPADKIRWMSYKDFRDEFPDKFPGEDLDKWLEEKLVYSADEAHGVHQTAEGAWAKFNGRTRMMKGLFNYETAYRQYTQRCLQDFVNDNIQYAEIRPNFMHTNQVWSTNGRQLYDNYEIMEIITNECNNFLEGRKGSGKPFFHGIKVIYCTPRSFPDHLIKDSLDECLELKRSPEIGHMIAGFDLVGQESAGRPLKEHVENLLEFQATCKSEGLEIPFLFHCGETLEMGTDTDGNVVDALLLGSKRIGHGFSLSRHPYIMEKMKKQNICLEVCPISNEILGLTPRIGGHAMYNLLANNVHCTVNSDNGTLFRSSLSHDFYQVFVGRDDFTLHGWRQLIEWSLEHACLDKDEYTRVYGEWRKLWDEFLDWILEDYKILRNAVTRTDKPSRTV